MDREDKKYLRRKRIIGICSLVAVLAVFGLLTYFVVYRLFDMGASPESFKALIESYGWAGRFVALGIQFLQIFVALIPGEFVEVGLGYAFGAIEGTLICYAGIALGSAAVFALAKKWGVKLVELFVDRQKIDSFRFINTEKRLNTLVFILFLIPGTPKDILTYIVPLTRMKMSEFLFITLIARLPSVLSSTIGGNMFGNENYLGAILLFVITGAISLAGLFIYKALLDKYHKHKESRNALGE